MQSIPNIIARTRKKKKIIEFVEQRSILMSSQRTNTQRNTIYLLFSIRYSQLIVKWEIEFPILFCEMQNFINIRAKGTKQREAKTKLHLELATAQRNLK